MNQIKKLKVAAIMDEFTYNCYAPECELMQVTPDNFKEELEGFKPDFLFIESVWRGKDNLWRFKLHDNMEAICALTGYCHENNIPVIFWSKEDPVHFGVFIRTAALADYVFTTDADCIELYKAHLGHTRVYYLPFAAQPAIHNPIEEYERKDKFCFAGSFYVKYKERSKVFMELAPLFKAHGLDIYDRNYKKEETDNNAQSTSVASPMAENYYFPEELRDCILGGLPYSEISRAYKGYYYGINMTSMVSSGFMFARRTFELLASNTVTVSNYSRGLEVFFGDLLISTNNRERMERQLNAFCKTELLYRKYRLAGLRHVLKNHLYEDRLDLIARKALGITVKKPMPLILVVSDTDNEHIRQMFNGQTYENKHLLTGSRETVIDASAFDYVTVFSPNDYYGKNYLMDMALATRFADAPVIGKAVYYSGGKVLNKEKAYTYVKEPLILTRQMASASLFEGTVTIDELISHNTEKDTMYDILSLDEFNYCENSRTYDEADDIVVNTGVPLDKICDYTDNIPPVTLHKDVPFPVEELYKEVIIQDSDLVLKFCDDGALRLVRDADDDKIVWLRTDKNYDISQFTTGSRIGFFSEVAEKTGNVRCQIEYYDENNVKLDFLNFALDGFSLLRISDRAKTFKLIFRMRGKSSVTLKSLYASSPDSLLPAPFPIRDSLLITESYPSYELPDVAKELHLFAKDVNAEVLVVSDMAKYIPYSEYDGIHIIAGQYGAIKEYLSVRTFSHVYVYSPTEKIMSELKDYKGETEVVSL